MRRAADPPRPPELPIQLQPVEISALAHDADHLEIELAEAL